MLLVGWFRIFEYNQYEALKAVYFYFSYSYTLQKCKRKEKNLHFILTIKGVTPACCERLGAKNEEILNEGEKIKKGARKPAAHLQYQMQLRQLVMKEFEQKRRDF